MQLGHTGLNVTDLDRSLAFYRQALGFTSGGEGSDGDRRWAALGFGGPTVLTLWQQSEGTHPADRPGLHHLAFRVETIEEVRAAETKLRELGATFHHDGVVPHQEGGAAGGIFFLDPDGIRLEVFAPTGAQGLTAPTAEAPTCGFF